MDNILKYQNPSSPLLAPKDTSDIQYLKFKETLPDNLRLTPEKDYHMYDYWKLSGEPKNFREGKRRGMFTWDRSDKGYHAGSIAEDRNTGIYHFMKPKHHPTVKYELDWFTKGLKTLEGGKQVPVEGEDKKFWEDFTSKYQLDTTGVDYRYVPIQKKGGRIHIKKKNRGKFTAAAKRAGMGVQEFARHVLANKDKYSPTLVKRANFARNSKKFKHENGGILKAQEGTGNKFWSKLWNAVKEGGMAARDAKLGAVGAQQVRDLYSEGKNQEAQDLAKQYAKANTTGIALAGGAASTGLLGDLMVTGATTTADTFIDGDTENFGKNLIKNTAGDLIGHGVFKGLKYFNGKPIFVKDMENGVGKGLYHLDYGDGKGAFNSGVYTKNGYLYPGKTDAEGQLDYIWFNESKPYTTALYDKPFSRTIIFDQNDVPGILRVREQKYPIGQWTGKSGFVTKHEMVTSNPVNMDNATIYKRIPVFDIWLRTK